MSKPKEKKPRGVWINYYDEMYLVTPIKPECFQDPDVIKFADSFIAKFANNDDDWIKKFMDAADVSIKELIVPLLVRHVIDWSGLSDYDKKPYPCTGPLKKVVFEKFQDRAFFLFMYCIDQEHFKSLKGQ